MWPSRHQRDNNVIVQTASVFVVLPGETLDRSADSSEVGRVSSSETSCVCVSDMYEHMSHLPQRGILLYICMYIYCQ